MRFKALLLSSFANKINQMKYSLLILFACLSITSCGQDSNFGEIISKENVMKFNEAAMVEDHTPVKIQGEITQTCSKKGCWMMLLVDGQEDLRVTFKDYGFFVPKEGMEGKNAIIEGELVKSVTDVETLRHFAEDAGKSKEEIAAITDPKEEYSFVASGVIIEN